jgi:hypothetical protein
MIDMHICICVHVDRGAEVGGRRLSPVTDDSHAPGLGSKVADTLDALPLQPEDAALAQLVREYAAQVDKAAAIAVQLAKLGPSDDFEEELARLRARVSAHTVLVDLGPKIQACLVELGATPKARAALPSKPKIGASRLTAMRGGA